VPLSPCRERPRSWRAPLGVKLAEPQLAIVAPRMLPITTEPLAMPAGFQSSDPDAVPPSAEKAAASAPYRARKRRHAKMARGGPSRSELHASGSQTVASPVCGRRGRRFRVGVARR